MMDDARAEFTAAPDWLYDLQRKAEKRAGRPRSVRADSPHPYRKDFGFSLSCEVKKIFIPTGNMVAKKSGGSREEMIPAGFILRATVTAPDGRQHRKFSIVSRTDPAKVAAMTAEIERICGPAAATQFSADAADVLATAKPRPAERPAIVAPGIHSTATFTTVQRFKKGSREQVAGTPMDDCTTAEVGAANRVLLAAICPE